MNQASALIDIGGSSVKISIRDNATLAIFSHELSIEPTISGKHIYLHPDQLCNLVIDAMVLCSLKIPKELKVNKIFISTLRQGFCLVEGERESTPIYLNSDTSGDYAREDIQNYGSDRIYAETGHWFAPQLTLPKLINLFRKNPDLKRSNPTLLFVHDWLVWRLTGQISTEMTLVSAGQMANLEMNEVHFDLLEKFGIPSTILPKPQKFGAVVSKLNSETLEQLPSTWTEAEVCIGGGDSHFLHMGASNNKLGTIVVSAGSSTPISLLSSTLGASSSLKPWKSTSFVRETYLLEGNLGYPGTFYGWLNKNLSEPVMDYELNLKNLTKASKVFGSCNMWNEQKWESRPAFLVFGDFSHASRNDLELGLTLDYSFALANQINELIKDKFEVNEVVITGGGANRKLQSFVSSLVDVSVSLLSTEDSINNLFSLLDNEDSRSIKSTQEATILRSEISEYLANEAKKHSLLYAELEGTREVLENVQ